MLQQSASTGTQASDRAPCQPIVEPTGGRMGFDLAPKTNATVAFVIVVVVVLGLIFTQPPRGVTVADSRVFAIFFFIILTLRRLGLPLSVRLVISFGISCAAAATDAAQSSKLREESAEVPSVPRPFQCGFNDLR